MPISIIATAGAANANSFVTLAEANAYIDGRLNASSWTDASTDTKNRALVEATRDISDLTYVGTRVDLTQALAWPREYALNPDAPEFLERGEISELYYAETVIPQRVKDATCELAAQYVKAGTTDLAAVDALANVTNETVGPLSTSWGPGGKPQGLARFPRVVGRLAPLLAAGLGTRMVRS
jgi:hypothetical protein